MTVHSEEDATISNRLIVHSTCSLSFTMPTCTFQQGGVNRGNTFFWERGGDLGSTVQKSYNAIWGGGLHACTHLQDDLAASVWTLCLQYQDDLLGLVWRALY